MLTIKYLKEPFVVPTLQHYWRCLISIQWQSWDLGVYYFNLQLINLVLTNFSFAGAKLEIIAYRADTTAGV